MPASANSQQPSEPESWSASQLRRDLCNRALHLASTQGLLHDQTPGNSSTVIFSCDERGRHGNFHPASHAAICANLEWKRRLTKVHTAHRKLRARADWPWMELDCANSSDALLMNIFCHPEVASANALSTPVADLLGIDTASTPHFGLHPGVPLASGLFDRTEIDLKLNTLFVEAKLTETGFQNAQPRLITRYRDLEEVFDTGRLLRPPNPITPTAMSGRDYWIDPLDDTSRSPSNSPASIRGYQLIRNVLAAYVSDASFCVLCDARRRDLLEVWYKVLSAVHRPTFATRLKLLTWQELAAVLPKDLQHFLSLKYGIEPKFRLE